MARLSLTLLGGFEARLASGSVLVVPTKKAQALLAFLAVPPGQPRSREKLAGLLWGDRGDAQARDSLRHTLVTLRKVLPATKPAVLLATGDLLSLNAATVAIDVVRFAERAAKDTASALEEAAGLYRGDFLDGFSLKEPSFDEWLATERERLRALALEALNKLLAHQTATGAMERATQTATRSLALDPCQEPVHRTLMRLYAQQRRRDAALRQYQVCAAVLQRQLGVQPEPQTRQLYQEILQQRASSVAANEALSAARRTASRARAPSAEQDAAARSAAALLGRDGEIARMQTALDDIWTDRGRVIVISGESGIGKSRLAAELVAEGTARGGRVLVGRAYETEQVLAFGPWVSALRDAGITGDTAPLSALEPAERAELARLLPGIGLPPAPAPAGAPSAEAHLRLFDAVVALLKRLAAPDPLVVVLEDVHWADDMTLRLIPFAARRLRDLQVGLAITTREEELADSRALRHALDEMSRELPLVQLRLAPLSREQTAALVDAMAGIKGEDLAAVHEDIWKTSEGNPFVIVETMRALAEGKLGGGSERIPLAPGVRDVIAGRLGRLRPESRQLVDAAAVIGRDFEFALLVRVVGLAEAEAATMVEELVRRQLLHAVGDRIDFVHDRIRAVARTAILPLRRRVLHGAVARGLEQLYAADLAPHYAALATHHREAGDRIRALEYLRRAADHALTAFAHRDAATFLDEALTLVGEEPGAERADVISRLATVAWYQGHPDTSAQLAEEALGLWIRLGDRRNQVAMRLHLAGLFISAAWNWERENEALAHLEAAAALVEDEPDSAQKGMIFQRTAHLYLHRGEPRTTLAWARRARDIYARLGVATGTSLGTALTYTGRVDEGIAHNEHNWESTVRSGNPVALVILSHELAVTHALLRDPARARFWAEQAAGSVRGVIFEAMAHRPLVLAGVLAGDFATAASASEVVVKGEREALVGCFLEATPAIGLYHLRRGEWSEARAYLERAIRSHEPRGNVQAVAACGWALGLVDFAAADHQRALERLSHARGVCQAGGNVLFELTVLAALIEAHLATEERDAAAQCLEKASQLLTPDQDWRGLTGLLEHARGLLARANHEWDVAAAAFERAVDIHRRYGLAWDEAHTLVEWGAMLTHQRTLPDRRRGREMVHTAAATFERIGAARDAESARAVIR